MFINICKSLLGMTLDKYLFVAEIAWSMPYRLYERLRHLDMNRISGMNVDELVGII